MVASTLQSPIQYKIQILHVHNMVSRCFRLHHTLTQYLIIFGSLVLFFSFYYFDGHSHQRSTESASASENEIKHRPLVDYQIDRPTTHNNPPTAITENSSASSFRSTCGAAADRRGPHQKVIGYSMYGSNFSDPKFYNKYLKWFGETLRTIPIKYPGWVVRIYHQLKSDDVDSWKALNDVLDLKGNGDHIDLCNATQVIRNRHLGDIFEMTWRWLPMLDDMVDTLMSRDSDSVIITREQDAVAEWLASNKTYHIMRDHPQHCLFFVGCCWGVKINQERSAIVAVAEEMFKKNHLHKKGYDQEILIKHFKTMAVKSMIAHDSYCCGKFPGSQPFPTPRQNGWFIGWQRKVLAELKVPCPENCRPHNLTGPAALADWSLC